MKPRFSTRSYYNINMPNKEGKPIETREDFVNHLQKEILRQAVAVKANLWFSDDEFLQADPVTCFSPLNYWFYSVLDDVFRILIKFISETEILDPNNPIQDTEGQQQSIESGVNFKRLLYEGVSFEFSFWSRKTLEHFCHMRLLSDVDKSISNKIAQIYFIAVQINDVVSKIQSYNEYFEVVPTSYELELEHIREEFRKCYSDISLYKDCFFFDGNPVPHIEAGKARFFKSHSRLSQEVLVKSDLNEKFVLGVSYGFYHDLTQPIHANWHRKENGISMQSVIAKKEQLLLLCVRLVGIISLYKGVSFSKDFEQFYNHPLSDEIDFEWRKFKAGDIVLYGSLKSEIKEIKVSKYNYSSYLLHTTLGTWSKEEWVPCFLVKNIAS
jgi:hypothetical protein